MKSGLIIICWLQLCIVACNANVDSLIEQRDSQKLIDFADGNSFSSSPGNYKKALSTLADICDEKSKSYIHNQYLKSENEVKRKFLLDLIPLCHSKKSGETLMADLLNGMETDKKVDDILLALRLIDNTLIKSAVQDNLQKAEGAAAKSPDAARLFLRQAAELAAFSGLEKQVAKKSALIMLAAQKKNLADVALQISKELEEGGILTAHYLAGRFKNSLKGETAKEAQKLYNSLHQLKLTEDKHFEASLKAEKLFGELLKLRAEYKEKKERKKPVAATSKKISVLKNKWHSARGDIIYHSRAMNRRRPQIKRLAAGYRELADRIK